MLCENCSCELWKPLKRLREEEDTSTDTTTTTDRLSHLPEPILYHILSFLDTKSAVRTSKLSRSWNRVWKHVPVLDLRVNSFRYACRFESFVSKVLTRRYPLKLQKVIYVQNFGPWNDNHKKRFVKIINYAFSHDVEELVLDTGTRCDDNIERKYRFSKLFYSFPSYNLFVMSSSKMFTSFSLKTLELSCVALDNGLFLCVGLPVLTTLKVTSCLLLLDANDHNHHHQMEGRAVDLFANFPCLMHLAMSDCFLRDRKAFGWIRVCRPQLLSLELDKMEQFKIDIFAPKLKSFGLRQDASKSQGFLELSLPSLDTADIVVIGGSPYWSKQHYLYILFQGLGNAKSLKLNSSILQVLKLLLNQRPISSNTPDLIVPVNGVPSTNPLLQQQLMYNQYLNLHYYTVKQEFMDQQPSPFKSLETLIVPSNDVPSVKFLFHDLRTGKPTKMGRYTIKALPLENGWEFVEPPMCPFMGPRAHMFMGDGTISTINHQIQRRNMGRFVMGADAELAQWDKIMDYFFKESPCEEPRFLVDFAGSNFVRKLL